MIYEFFAACPKGLESLLFDELHTLGATDIRETVAGVYFHGDHRVGYRVCLWSRLANKVLLPLKTISLKGNDSLYEGAASIAWDEHIDPEGTLSVDFLGTNDQIRNTQYGAVRVKDAIVDHFRSRYQTRPSVQKQQPDLLVNARLSKGKVVISIDLAGYSLHRRGYRSQQGIAPLKENLAAAILLRAQWPAIAANGGTIIDPMCGSATLLIEAAMMVADIAPGFWRSHFGFSRWRQFQPEIWAELRQDAVARREKGIETLRELTQNTMEFRGYDNDHRVLKAAESNILNAGLEAFIRVVCKPVEALSRPTHKPLSHGLLVCNPPYGERLGEEKALQPLYQRLGELLKTEFTGWQAGIFTANSELAKKLHIRAVKKYKFYNGSLETHLFRFEITDEYFIQPKTTSPWKALDTDDGVADGAVDKTAEPAAIKQVPCYDDLSSGAQMVCNRLKKNAKQLRKWVNKQKISSYRVYDADMPEYAAAIDLYNEYVHVQEYAAPKTVDENKAAHRLDELMNAIPVAFDVLPENIFLKQRRRNKGKEQYQRLEQQQHRALIKVQEASATLLVNLWSYLDTGLFLDHRPVRRLIAQQVSGKRFLNLFCYTASASVQAALAGASASVSVDMSATYLKWAADNFQANHISETRHQLVAQDCMSWLNECRQGFDLILLDPPSFSNSKRMQDVFDVQRDHVTLVRRCMDILTPGGTLIFSNNLRSFSLEPSLENDYTICDITEQTLDPDFQRNRKIHRCYTIKHKESA